MDVAARVAADQLGKALGQRFVVENRSGSGGNIGTPILVTGNAKLPASDLKSLIDPRQART